MDLTKVYYARLAILAMHDKLTRLGVCFTLMRLMDADVVNDAKSVTKLYDDTVTHYRLVSGMLLYRCRAGTLPYEFWLETVDRTVAVTESFLSTCAPDHAEAIRKQMKEW